MIWYNIQYDWPGAALFLFVVLVLIWALVELYRFRQKKLRDFAEDAVLDVIVEKRRPMSFWTKAVLYCTAWICGVLALMQPKGNERYLTPSGVKREAPQMSQKVMLRKKMHDVIFLVDASASMDIKDAHEGTSRLDVAKEIGDNIISSLRGQNVSLYAFTSATIQLVPSTLDYLFTRLMLRQLQINEGQTEGTDLLQALEDARRRYFSSSTMRPKTLVLLTDGGDTKYESLQGEAKEKYLQSIIKPIEDAEAQHLQVIVVGMGSREGKEIPGISFEGHPVHSSLDEALLKRLSSASQGKLFIANDMSPLQISDAITRSIAQTDAYEDQTAVEQALPMNENQKIYDLYYQFPLGIALLALALAILMPDTRKRKSEEPESVA